MNLKERYESIFRSGLGCDCHRRLEKKHHVMEICRLYNKIVERNYITRHETLGKLGREISKISLKPSPKGSASKEPCRLNGNSRLIYVIQDLTSQEVK